MNTLRTMSGISGLGFAQAPEPAKKMTGYKSFVGEHFKTMMAGSIAGLRRIKTIMEDHFHDLERCGTKSAIGDWEQWKDAGVPPHNVNPKIFS